MSSRVARLREQPAVLASAGVFAATACSFLAIGAVLPVLPRYVRGPVGAGDLAVGVVVGCFALAAIVGRPVGGRLIDRRGRRAVHVTGSLIAAVAGLLYFLPFGVPGLVLARLVLGLGDGWVFTAGATWIVDLAPPARRGQAIGLFGLAIWGGLAVGPICGEALLAVGSYEAVWAFSAVMPLLGALIGMRLPDAHVPPASTDEPAPFLPRPVVLPGFALALANAGYGTMAGFVVLHLDDQGIGHGAAVFTAFAVSVVTARLVLGHLPDRLGAQRTAVGAAVAEALGLALVAAAGGLVVAFAGAIVMGIGFSLLFPSLAVLAVARTGEDRRGAAMGAFTAFFDLGVGIGAPLAGAVAAVSGYDTAFWVAAAAATVGVLVSVRLKPEPPSP